MMMMMIDEFILIKGLKRTLITVIDEYYPTQ
jgi:hypothetical protein